MRLFNQNAERLLFEKAKSLTGQHSSWRCIYINFSAHKDECSEGLRTNVVTNIIKELLEGEDGYIYLCEDGDVFILFQGKASTILNKLGEHFKGLGDARKAAHANDTLYTIFDLGAEWERFFELCGQKHSILDNKKIQAVHPTAAAYPPLREFNSAIFQLSSAKRAQRQRLTVLLVEDDPFTRRLICGTLKNDFDVVEAGSGSEAIAAYERHAPDAVFLDIELPDSNGHAVLNRMLACDASAFVVMLSANSMKENILAALEKGAQGFVAKPFAKEKLMHYLKSCATLRRSGSHSHAGAQHV